MRCRFGDFEVLDCQRLACFVHNSGSHVGFPLGELVVRYWTEQIIDPSVLQPDGRKRGRLG